MAIIYTGIFFNRENTEKLYEAFPAHLLRQIANPHVTLIFRPIGKNQHTELFGTKATVKITGYARDEDNEGVLVSVHSEDERLRVLYSSLPKPHITLAVSTSGSPVNTARLDFEPCDGPTLTGTFDAFRG